MDGAKQMVMRQELNDVDLEQEIFAFTMSKKHDIEILYGETVADEIFEAWTRLMKDECNLVGQRERRVLTRRSKALRGSEQQSMA